jgi:hypothetical protein
MFRTLKRFNLEVAAGPPEGRYHVLMVVNKSFL